MDSDVEFEFRLAVDLARDARVDELRFQFEQLSMDSKRRLKAFIVARKMFINARSGKEASAVWQILRDQMKALDEEIA